MAVDQECEDQEEGCKGEPHGIKGRAAVDQEDHYSVQRTQNADDHEQDEVDQGTVRGHEYRDVSESDNPAQP